MMLLLIGVAFLCHTAESRQFAQAFVRGLAGRMKHDEAAQRMGLTPQMLSRQLAGRELLAAYRIVQLPADVQIAIFAAHLRLLGAEVLAPEQMQIIKGAAVLGLKRMLKMLPVVHDNPIRKEA